MSTHSIIPHIQEIGLPKCEFSKSAAKKWMRAHGHRAKYDKKLSADSTDFHVFTQAKPIEGRQYQRVVIPDGKSMTIAF